MIPQLADNEGQPFIVPLHPYSIKFTGRTDYQ